MISRESKPQILGHFSENKIVCCWLAHYLCIFSPPSQSIKVFILHDRSFWEGVWHQCAAEILHVKANVISEIRESRNKTYVPTMLYTSFFGDQIYLILNWHNGNVLQWEGTRGSKQNMEGSHWVRQIRKGNKDCYLKTHHFFFFTLYFGSWTSHLKFCSFTPVFNKNVKIG